MSSDEEDLSAEPLQLQLLMQDGLSWQLQWNAKMFCCNQKNKRFDN